MTFASMTNQTYGELLHRCVACGAERIRFWRRKHYQYTSAASTEEFRIYRCQVCGTGFLNRPPHRDWLEEIYQYSGQALAGEIGLDEVLRRERFYPNCKVDAKRIAHHADRCNATLNYRALDIGSGFGFYTRALRLLGYRTVSINPGAYENKVFEQMNGDLPLPIMFEDYRSEERFGVVVMSQVLEHLLEPEQAVRKVAALLETGGVLACAVPNYASFLVKLLGANENACLWVPEHVNFFTEQGLRTLFERNGLQVVKTEQITRVPFDALSRRLGAKGRLAALLNRVVKYAQIPFSGLMNLFGMGIYLNVYAVKTAAGE